MRGASTSSRSSTGGRATSGPRTSSSSIEVRRAPSDPMGPIGTHWDPTDGLQHAGGAAARAPAEALARTRAARASPPAPALARSRAARSDSSAVGPHLRACDDHRSDLVCDVFGLCLPQGISQSFLLLIIFGPMYFAKQPCAFVRLNVFCQHNTLQFRYAVVLYVDMSMARVAICMSCRASGLVLRKGSETLFFLSETI